MPARDSKATGLLKREAMSLLERVLGFPPNAAEVVDTIDDRLVVIAEVDGHAVVLKASAFSSVDVEACALQLAADAGVAVPRIIAVGDAPRLPGHRFVVMERIAGLPLDRQSPRVDDVMASVGHELATLHSVLIDRFGRLVTGRWDEKPIRVHGREDTWVAALESIVRQNIESLLEAGDLSASRGSSWTDDVLELVAAAERAHPTHRASLLHGDLEYFHIFEDEGGFTGIIDFGECLAGDPAWDIARFSLRLDNFKDSYPFDSQLDIGTVVEAYGQELGHRLSAWWRPYLAIRALQEAGWCRRNDYDWGAVSALLAIADHYIHA